MSKPTPPTRRPPAEPAATVDLETPAVASTPDRTLPLPDETPPPAPTSDQTLASPDSLVPPAPPAPDQTLALDSGPLPGPPGEGTRYHAQPPSGAAVDQTLAVPGPEATPVVDHTVQRTGEWSSTGEPAEFSVASRAASIRDPSLPGSGRQAPGLPQLPGYEILGELGRGAMGVVYKARQIGLKRLVALKMILSGGHASSGELVRFRTEAEAVARLQHPNIVAVYEIGEHGGLPFFSLEFVEGGCLADQLVDAALPARQAAQLLRQLAEAMACAHEMGIIHRDLKPANVLMTRDGIPKITDFGLAKKLEEDSGATRAGAIMGTPSYMAPEQAEGRTDQVGPPADVYALGAILYDLLTGRPPFRGTTVLETLTQVRTIDPVPPARLQPHMPRDLETICLTCLHKEVNKRYPSARALAEDLRRFLAGEPIQARPTPAIERAWKWCKRRPTAAALVGVSALSVVLLSVGGVAFARAEHHRANEAERLRQDADDQRKRAEGHFRQARQAVDEMLGRVGGERLAHEPRMEQVRRDLLEKALQFYDGFLETEGSSPAVRHGAALASAKVGEIRALLGQDAQAEASYLRAISMLGELADEHAQEASYRKDLAAACNNLANLYRQMRLLDRAGPLYDRAVSLFQKLAADHPDDRATRQDLALTLYSRGLLEETQAQSRKAILSMRSAQALQANLVEEDPRAIPPRQALARTWTVLGRLQGATQPAEAERSLREARGILEGLVKEAPANPTPRQELLVGSLLLGDLLRNRQPKEAGVLFTRAVALGEALVADFPTIPDYQQQLAGSYNSQALWHQAGGRRKEAGKAHERALALKERLASNFPRNADYLRDLARSQGNYGLFLQTAGDNTGAEKAYRRSVELLRDLSRRFPGQPADEQQRALALVRLAGFRQGSDPEGAAREMREALAIQDGLLARDGRSRDYQAERASTGAALATLLRGQGKAPEAEKLHVEAEKAFRDLVKRFPDETSYRFSLASNRINLGYLQEQSGRASQAGESYQEAATLLGDLVKEKPDQPGFAQEQARALHNLGILQMAGKKLPEAEATHRRALALRKALAERHPGEPGHRRDLATSLAELGKVLVYRNRLQAGEESLREAVSLLEKLQAEQPDNVGFLNDLMTEQGNLAGLLHALGRDDDAINQWRRRLAAKEKLAGTSPGQRSERGRMAHELGAQLMSYRRPAEARKVFEEAIRDQRRALDLAPKNEAFRALLGAHALALADALLAEKDHLAAARAVADVVPDMGGNWQQYPVAAALLARAAGLAGADEKLPVARRKEAANGHAQKAVELLRKALAAGFRDADALSKAKEFDAVRDREDFKQVVAEMRKKDPTKGA